MRSYLGLGYTYHTELETGFLGGFWRKFAIPSAYRLAFPSRRGLKPPRHSESRLKPTGKT